MIRGTTPIHTFNIPFDTDIISKVRIIYAQNDTVLFTKTEADCDFKDKSIIVTLTQEDTFRFDHKEKVQIQLRVLTAKGEALSSTVDLVGVSKCLEDEVLV